MICRSLGSKVPSFRGIARSRRARRIGRFASIACPFSLKYGRLLSTTSLKTCTCSLCGLAWPRNRSWGSKPIQCDEFSGAMFGGAASIAVHDPRIGDTWRYPNSHQVSSRLRPLMMFQMTLCFQKGVSRREKSHRLSCYSIAPVNDMFWENWKLEASCALREVLQEVLLAVSLHLSRQPNDQGAGLAQIFLAWIITQFRHWLRASS